MSPIHAQICTPVLLGVLLSTTILTVMGNKRHNFNTGLNITGECPRAERNLAHIHFSHESRLINCLLERYAHITTHARPVSDSNSNVVVFFGVSLIQILDFDEIKQVMTTSIWKNYVWTDQVLRWDPVQFGGVTHIRLPASHIWTPDIVLYNNADEQVKQHEELAAVFYNGTVKWIPPAIYRSSCEIDMRNFPFDVQTCTFKFGSWTYDQHKVDLMLFEERMAIDLREYVPSSEWDVLSTSATRSVRQYQFFDTDPYPELLFQLSIKRQSTFYIYLLVLPCVLLSSLTLVLFWIPPTRPDRTAVGMSLFSSFFILLLILVQSSPPTSASISRLGINYCVNMVLIAVSTILSVAIINIGQSARPTNFVNRRVLLRVASFLCIRKEIHPLSDETYENGVYNECVAANPLQDNATTSRQARDLAVKIDSLSSAQTWTIIAAILDRIFFLIYLLVIFVLSTVFMLPK